APFPVTADLMQRSRARSAALASGLAVLCASTAPTAPTLVFAQEPPAPPADATEPTEPVQAEGAGVVNRIIVQGNERIEQSTVLSYLPIQQGEPVDAAKIDTALKALFRTDLFADV